MRWILPLLLIGLVGCAQKSYPGQWESTAGSEAVTLNVTPDGRWTAQTDAGEVSGTWIREGSDRVLFIQKGEIEPAEAALESENHLVLRTSNHEVRFDRR